MEQLDDKTLKEIKSARKAYYRDYMKKYRENNKERIKEINNKFWLKKANENKTKD